MAKGQTGKWVEGRRKTHLLLEAAQSAEPIEFFFETATLTSAAAATAVNILSDARVGAGRKVYLLGYVAKVNGATNWATTANIKIQDTNSSAVDFITTTVNAATTNGNVVSFLGSNSNVAAGAGMVPTPGGTLGKGLQVKADANGTGSDYVVTVWGIIK